MARILAVDDDPRVRRFVRQTLRAEGHDVIAVADAESAIAQLLSARPDLFLLDINLPGMNGIALAQKLREQRGTQSIPVIILSVRTDPHDKVAAYASGAVTYLEKPFKKSDLVNAVRLGLRIGARDRA
ncbi:MAG: PleD family two-component system response regulator [Planctomycetota bacterium]